MGLKCEIFKFSEFVLGIWYIRTYHTFFKNIYTFLFIYFDDRQYCMELYSELFYYYFKIQYIHHSIRKVLQFPTYQNF